jgi:hypothetical protein
MLRHLLAEAPVPLLECTYYAWYVHTLHTFCNTLHANVYRYYHHCDLCGHNQAESLLN